jgi:hypothetical protein
MNPTGDVNRDLIRSNGWRQGAISRLDELNPLFTPDWFSQIAQTNGALAILITHDCDILNHSLIKEPSVQWLIATPIKKLNSRCTNGMNCRTFHFEYDGSKYEAIAHRTIETPRNLLENGCTKIQPLSRELTANLAYWISKRVYRPAFPDEFNRRLSQVANEIREKLDADHSLLKSIFIKVHPSEEIPDQAEYAVSLVGMMSNDEYAVTDSREKSQAVLDALETYLNECNGVAVVDSRLGPQEAITLTIFDDHVPWDFDYLTFRDQEG